MYTIEVDSTYNGDFDVGTSEIGTYETLNEALDIYIQIVKSKCIAYRYDKGSLDEFIDENNAERIFELKDEDTVISTGGEYTLYYDYNLVCEDEENWGYEIKEANRHEQKILRQRGLIDN